MNIEFKEMITNVETKIADANAKLARTNGRGGFYLTIRDGAMVVTSDGKLFRLSGSGADVGHRFATFREAVNAANVWNNALTAEQRAANCAVTVSDFRTYMCKAIEGWMKLKSILVVAA